jgi:hypothetical protein
MAICAVFKIRGRRRSRAALASVPPRQKEEGRSPAGFPCDAAAFEVGETGFEPATPWSRRLPTGIRYGWLETVAVRYARNYGRFHRASNRCRPLRPIRTAHLRHIPGTARRRPEGLADRPRGRVPPSPESGNGLPLGCGRRPRFGPCVDRSDQDFKRRGQKPDELKGASSRRFKSGARSARHRTPTLPSRSPQISRRSAGSAILRACFVALRNRA